jgi:hypothetical protein
MLDAEHYRRRISDLGDVIDGARAGRELAMYRAHQHGATPEEIARWALIDVADVRNTIELLGKEEPAIDEWSDAPHYIEIRPSRA